MRFTPTELAGVFAVDIEPLVDERGFFARSWCAEEFAAHGLSDRLTQCSISLNHARGTLRGVHYQAPPHAEAKLVRCTQGALFDVAVDLRPASPTLGRWVGVELSAANHRMLYLPEGCAHGFQTLDAQTEVFYQISVPYHAASARGVRFDDPCFGIRWPLPPVHLSPRDAGYPDFVP